ncbi:MAG: DNA translocase FtsK [Caldicoprobacterales bacterium]|jgi:S-DNA-T family DNA segregation ATPase FtsK/SpoIIIE
MRKKRRKTAASKRGVKYEISGLLTASLGLFLGLTIYSRGLSAGAVGLLIYPVLKGLFGIVSYILPVIIVIAGILIVAARSKKLNRSKLALTVFSVYFFLCFVHLLYFRHFSAEQFSRFIMDSYRGGMESPALGAGAFCAPVVYIVYSLFGLPGAVIFFITVTIVCLLLLTNLSLRQLGKRISKSLKLHRIADALNDYRKKSRENRKKVVPSPAPEAFSLLTAEAEVDHTSSAEPDLSGRQQDDDDTDIKIIDFTTERDNEIIAPTAQENEADNKNGASIPEIVVQQESLPYMIPPIALLKEPVTRKNAVTAEKIVKRNARILTDTLNSFGVSAKVVQISRGPVITRYELQPAPGVKVSRIVNLSDDIALNMAAPGVRIEAPIPGKAAVGIEVPNKNVAPVILREVLESDDFFNHPSRLAFALGKDIAGNNVIADIAMMPHLLIAGATGSGKSVCINSLITSILYKATPDEVRLIMIDPKVVELSSYNGIPHLMIPVVTDPRKAAGALNWAVQEMGTRYKMFADKGVRDIVRYNEQIQDNEKKLPQIVVIIDELADLMMVAPSEVEDAICRLAQMARAAGIHLVIATQRPSVDVITGVIKANIPSRIAFAVSSQTDSRTILDMGGAEKLLGRGDMLFYPSGANKPKRVQGAFITEEEVEAIVSCIKSQNEAPKYQMEVLEETAADQDGPNGSFDDELLPDAIEVVIDAGQASISMIQRRLRVGYARAARLIDEMEVRGLVSGFDGSKPRNVLITREEFEESYRNK